MTQLLTILCKELKDSLRDHRSLLAALLVALLAPLVLGVMFGSLVREGKQGQSLVITMLGAERAPSLVNFLKRQGAIVNSAPADFEAQIRAGRLDAVIVVPEKYGEEFVSGRPAKLNLIADSSHSSSYDTVPRIVDAIRRYSGEVSELRLLARGVSPEIAQAVDLQEKDLSTQKSRSATLLSMIPIFLMVTICTVGIYSAVDSTAGERERGSLEPLLLNPVRRQTLVAGKWAAVVLFSLGGFALTLANILSVLKLIPLQQIGISLGIGVHEVLIMILIALPLALFVSSLELLLATFARTVREGQTYLSLLSFAALVPGMLMQVNHVNPAPWMAALPILGQQMLFSALLRGENGAPFGLFIATMVSVALTAICLRGTARLMTNERIILAP